MFHRRCYSLRERNKAVLEGMIKTLDSLTTVGKSNDLSVEEMHRFIEAMIKDCVKKLEAIDAS